MFKVKKVLAIAVAIALVSVFLFTGCGANKSSENNTEQSKSTQAASESKATESTKESNEPVTLRFAAPEGPFKGEIEAFAEGFKNVSPNTTVQYEPLAGNWEEKLLTQISSGTAADVFWVPDVRTPVFASKGALLELDQYFSKFNVDKEDIFPAMLATGMYNGKVYMIPRDYNHIVTFYNKVLFQKAGVAFPKNGWTWQEFVDTATKLTVKDGKTFTQRGCDASLLWQATAIPMILGLGGSITDPYPAGTAAAFDTPGTISALKEIKTLVDSGVLVNNVTNDVGDIFGGKVAMAFHVRPIASTMNDKIGVGNWDVVTFPALPAKHVVGSGASGYSVYSGSKVPDEAAKLVFYIISEAGQEVFMKTGNSISVRKSLISNELWRSMPTKDHNQDAYIDQPEFDVPPLALTLADPEVGMLDFDAAWINALTALLNGEKSPEEAAKYGQSELANLFKK